MSRSPEASSAAPERGSGSAKILAYPPSQLRPMTVRVRRPSLGVFRGHETQRGPSDRLLSELRQAQHRYRDQMRLVWHRAQAGPTGRKVQGHHDDERRPGAEAWGGTPGWCSTGCSTPGRPSPGLARPRASGLASGQKPRFPADDAGTDDAPWSGRRAWRRASQRGLRGASSRGRCPSRRRRLRLASPRWWCAPQRRRLRRASPGGGAPPGGGGFGSPPPAAARLPAAAASARLPRRRRASRRRLRLASPRWWSTTRVGSGWIRLASPWWRCTRLGSGWIRRSPSGR